MEATNQPTAATITAGEQERLEIQGYCWGRDHRANLSPTPYRWAGWNDAQAAAFAKGYKEGRDYSIALGER